MNGDIILLSNLYIQFQAMENNRDDFSSVVKDVLAKRVGYLCSNCRQPTVGANQVPTKATSFGIDAQAIGRVEDNDKKQLLIKANGEELVY